ncbi:MAG: GerMN domain-containing protein [Holophagales bacterium]|nr:GerMN domain-containing protein [Holophagales bacterium]
MPRRFALALLALLVLLLLGLLAGRRVHEERQRRRVAARPTPTRTVPPPPTPIPARLVSIWFENVEDGYFHPEAREVPAAVDDVAFLRSLAAAVLEGPRHPALQRPFPDGWTLRAAFRLADGLAVLDLAPPAPLAPTPAPEPSPSVTEGKKGAKPEPTPTTPPPVAIAEPPARWETGSSEEVGAVQALVLTVTKNLHSVSRVILLVGGEPVETLAGHVDLTHPLLPDLSRAADEAPLVAPMPEPAASPAPAAAPPDLPAAPVVAPPVAPSPTARTAPGPAGAPRAPSPVPTSVQAPAAAPRPVARPTPRPAKDTYRT